MHESDERMYVSHPTKITRPNITHRNISRSVESFSLYVQQKATHLKQLKQHLQMNLVLPVR